MFGRRFSGLAAASALLVLALGAPATASVVVGYDLGELVERSEHAVAAEVQATSSRYDDRGRIVTDVEIRVDEVGKGRARRGETLALVVLGGSIGEVTMRVEGGVRLAPGDRAMLFLERHPSGPLVPVGLSQGVLPIRETASGRQVLPGGAGLALVRARPDGRMVPTPSALSGPEDLDALLERVRSLAGGARR